MRDLIVIKNIEDTWDLKSRAEILEAIQLCLFRCHTARSPWARKYWFSVAEGLEEKYVH